MMQSQVRIQPTFRLWIRMQLILLPFFAKQDPYSIRMLTALRMNATFPIVLPNVWLPSEPVIDVMDAGLRDNYGQETTLRFLSSFDDWIKENTSGVLIITDQRPDSRWVGSSLFIR